MTVDVLADLHRYLRSQLEPGLFEFDEQQQSVAQNILRDEERNAKKLISFYRSIETNGKMPEVEFAFADDLRVGALAYKSTAGECIAVRRGYVLLIYDTIKRMLSLPTILPNLGVAGAESAERVTLGDFSGHGAHLLDDACWIEPVDPARQYCATVLARLACCSVVAHELAHLRHGHLDFRMLKEGDGQKAVAFIDTPTPMTSKLSMLTHQALEMDADAFAAVTTMDQCITIFGGDVPLSWQRRSKIVATFGARLNLFCAISLYLPFRLLAQINEPTRDRYDYPHAPPTARATMALATMLAALESREPAAAAKEKMDVAAPEAISAVEEALFLLTGKKPKISDFDNNDQVGEILAEWKRIRSELLSLTRSLILAP